MSISYKSQKTPERAIERIKAALERSERDWEQAYGPYAMSRAADDKAYYWRVLQRLEKKVRKIK